MNEPVNWDVVGVGVGVALVFSATFIAYSVQRATARTPRGIAKRLRHPGDRVELRIPGTGAVWDPGRPPGQDNARWGPARATYTVDAAGLVNLHFQPALGTAEDSSGPVPALSMRPVRIMRAILAGYLAIGLAGFVIGFLVSNGPVGERMLWGYGGVLAAVLIVLFTAMTLGVGKAVRDTARPRRPASW